MTILQSTLLLASTEAEATQPGIFEALGIDWKLLLLQTAAFLILVWFLSKFVYPTLIKSIDNRQKAIEESVAAANEAQAKAEAAESEVQKILKEARKEAEDIVATAHKETTLMIDDAEKKAQKKADHITTEAREQISKDVAAARQALKDETKQLVALATEKIVKEKVDAKRDSALIESALKEAKQ